MHSKGTDIWWHICDSITDDTDRNMVDLANTVSSSSEGGTKTELAFMTPYRQISEQGLTAIEKAFVKIAAEASVGTSVDEIRVTPPTYHFFNEKSLDAFFYRLHDLIEDSWL